MLVNAETGKPVDLLRDREADTFADWLKEHPGTEVICRDRAGAYADGARTGAPDAIQVADRWHLYHNPCGHVEKAVARHRDCLKEPEPGQEPAASEEPAADLEQAGATAAQQRAADSTLARRKRERYEQVQALRAQGLGIKPVWGLHLTGATQVSALPPESAWQGPDPGRTCGFCSVDRKS